MRRFGLIFLVLLAFTASGLTSTAAPNGSARWAHPALWRIQSGTTTMYLLGSMHVIPSDLAWVDREVDAAMRASDIFVFETLFNSEAQENLREVARDRGLLPGGKTLRSLLSEKGLADYTAVMKGLGLPVHQLDRYKPWVANNFLRARQNAARAITDPGSVDYATMAYAQSHGRELRKFATPQEQHGVFSEMDDATALAVFEANLADFHGYAPRMIAALEAWTRGDSEALAAITLAQYGQVPAAFRALLEDRNTAWVQKITAFMREPNRTFFVTVGAGHYGGKQGMLAMLCAAGFRVVRVGRDGGADRPDCGPNPV